MATEPKRKSPSPRAREEGRGEGAPAGLIFSNDRPPAASAGAAVNRWYLTGEAECMRALLDIARLPPSRRLQ